MARNILILLLLVLFSGSAAAAEADANAEFDVKAHYDKAEYKVPMRDGVKLHTVVYSPKDKSQTYPFLIMRTPYSAGPYGPETFRDGSRLAPSREFLEDGYIFVVQDGRGTYNSEGVWENLRPVRTGDFGTDEATDSYDSLEWLLANVPGNNGRAGQWGISHPGWYTVMGLIGAHPALRAVSPQATTFDPFMGDDDHHNGAYTIKWTGWWYMQSIVTSPERGTDPAAPEPIDKGTPWDYEFFLNAGPTNELNERHYNGRMTQVWQNLIDHPDYDEFWESRNVARSLNNVKIPVLNVAGWFDGPDPYGAIATYQSIEEQNSENKNVLVAGPWRHGGWLVDDGSSLGNIQFGDKQSDYFKKEIIFPFFQYHLKDKGDWSPAEAMVFETGNNRWHHLAKWPPASVEKRNIYLREDFRLSFDKPSGREAEHDSYLSDPAKPVPHSPEIPVDKLDPMVADQRFASTRPDVLTYQTGVLTEDLTIAGPILANLFASTTGTDSDWVVKLIDVYPGDAPDFGEVKMGGYQMQLGAEIMRGKYRNSMSSPEPMTPGEVTPISFHLWDKFHTFKKGHKIMVQVQSSWFPVFDRNPQIFTDIYRAKKGDYKKATQKIYRSGQSPTHLVLPVLRP